MDIKSVKANNEVRVHCPVCGNPTLVLTGKLVDHNDKKRKNVFCYGSKMPMFFGSRGALHPGEVIYPCRQRGLDFN